MSRTYFRRGDSQLLAAGSHALISRFFRICPMVIAHLSPYLTFHPEPSQTATAFSHQKPFGIHPSRSAALHSRSVITTSLGAMPICIVVEAEIVEDRMGEFLDMIEKNAIGSRAEPGCIRFGAYAVAKHRYSSFLSPHVLQAEGAPNKFIFYEIYQSTDDISYHKEQPHYLAWVAFKESGGTISSISTKASGKFLT
ncbi:hypothetical protein ACHAXA_001544 [Cyclostephanos tholiformis]|uniref:ABM domain-containing protein n=1 Tax=Cyclostephanos tholiformis TaxID=382380 RepID=A0ABD3R7K3_9STRA